MAYAPIFATCYANSSVKTLLGSSPMKLFLFGEAPQDVELPYAVWQEISGRPYNYLGSRPDMDMYRIQVDVYANDSGAARQIRDAIITAIELKSHVVSFNGEDRDTDTKAFRSSFDIAWHVDT